MSKLVLVETVLQYRMRYVVEVPDDHMEREYPCPAITWAEDTVTMEEANEFSQLYLGEQIISSREVTKDEVLRLCDIDNAYLRTWPDEQKLATFVTPIKQEESNHGTQNLD
jgi:hypothetical protein